MRSDEVGRDSKPKKLAVASGARSLSAWRSLDREESLSERSAEQVRAEHLDRMGPELGPLFHALYEEVVDIHVTWNEFLKLYGKSDSRIELLKDSAGFFFSLLQRVLWHDVILHIARLTDPAEQQGKKNLTLLALAPVIGSADLKAKVDGRVQRICSDAGFARDQRNRRLAHRDRAVALGAQCEPLQAVGRARVERVLTGCSDVLRLLLSAHGIRGHAEFRRTVVPVGDADALVHHVSFARWFQEQRMDRARRGKWRAEDNEMPPPV